MTTFDVVRLPTLLDLYDELGPCLSPAPLVEDESLPMLMQVEHANERDSQRRRGRQRR